jgi:hypothetical protein
VDQTPSINPPRITEPDPMTKQEIENLQRDNERLLKAIREAEAVLLTDIPSHPMRDKCFAVMSKARTILEAAYERQ